MCRLLKYPMEEWPLLPVKFGRCLTVLYFRFTFCSTTLFGLQTPWTYHTTVSSNFLTLLNDDVHDRDLSYVSHFRLNSVRPKYRRNEQTPIECIDNFSILTPNTQKYRKIDFELLVLSDLSYSYFKMYKSLRLHVYLITITSHQN